MYYRLRGIDQTRINSTLNGIPLNEPEDQGIYYNNYGGFLNAVSNIQIIRGAGLSKPGVSSYGGSINFSSLEFANKFSGSANLLYGSYNTFQITGTINTPQLFLVASKMSTDGYKLNSFNDSWSTFYGVKQKYGKHELKMHGFIGNQKNGMAWLGEPLDNLYKNPKYNSNTKDETDDFLYVHNQLSWQYGGLKTTVYYTALNGWYTTDIGHFDPSHEMGDLIWKLALKSSWVGANVNYNLPLSNVFYLNLGTNAYTYSREHTGTYSKLSTEEPWYYNYVNTGNRLEVSPYAKAELKIDKISLYGDVQYRYTTFAYDGDASIESLKWKFLNWSSGVSVKVKDHSYVYYGIGKTFREPTRNDLFGGMDNLDPSLYNYILPEEALNNEFGWKYKTDYLSLNANLYYMKFKNEIVLNGKVGPNSIVLHQNAAESFRSGIEFEADWKATTHWEFLASNSLSFNRIQQDNESFQPVLTPSVLLSYDAVFNASKSVYTGLNIRFNGNSYIEFSNEHQLPSYALLSVYGGIKWKGFEVKGRVNNLLNELILTNAIMSGTDPYYFALAGTNGSLSLTYKF
jgi:iron complex outermembrane receptor protein